MIPTFLALASTLFFNQLWLWRIHQCVPSFQPGPVLPLLPGITGSQQRSATTFSSKLSRSTLPHTISKTHSKHIVPSGGFAQPTLSLMLRREDLRNPSQHVGLSTSDRVLVGLSTVMLRRD